MRYRFAPQPDITAFELAVIMSRIAPDMVRSISNRTFVDFPPGFPKECERHFEPCALATDSGDWA